MSLGRSVSLDQAAELLAVSRRTIYNYLRDGRLTTIQAGESQRVLRSSIEAFTRRPPRARAAAVDELIAREAGVPLPFGRGAG